MELSDYHPISKLITPVTEVLNPRFPVIDAHNHLGEQFGGGWDKRPLPELLEVLDAAHVQAFIDLDGGWGEQILQRHLDHFKAGAPERFRIFGGVDWSQWAEQGDHFGEWAANRLRYQAAIGAQGLKIWKPLGLHVRDHHNHRVAVDDERLDPVWATAGELGLPVVIHVADPVAFFDPLDQNNERWEELNRHPDWYFPSPPFPAFITILEELARLVERHPQTTFVGAHVGCYAENLAWVANLLERCPNFYIDISARIGELGRQPYSTRRFFEQFADRILFGTDSAARVETYRLYYRFLETTDEYFSYDGNLVPGQGRWYIHALGLPDEVLEKVYFRNAQRVLL